MFGHIAGSTQGNEMGRPLKAAERVRFLHLPWRGSDACVSKSEN
jgi:hypothetical protein